MGARDPQGLPHRGRGRELTARIAAAGMVALVAVVAAGRGAADDDPLFAALAGTWGLPGVGECGENPVTLRFSEDRRSLFHSYRIPIETSEGPVQYSRYEIVGVAGPAMRLRLDGETRSTESGTPVVWDLVLHGPDSFCWHRADWVPGACTPPRFRCESALADLVGLMRAFSAQVIDWLAEGEYAAAADLLALPDALTDEARERERRRLATSLAILVRELGAPGGAKPMDQVDPLPPSADIAVAALRQQVAIDLSEYRFLLFEVVYAKADPGASASPSARRVTSRGWSSHCPRARAQRIAEIGEHAARRDRGGLLGRANPRLGPRQGSSRTVRDPIPGPIAHERRRPLARPQLEHEPLRRTPRHPHPTLVHPALVVERAQRRQVLRLVAAPRRAEHDVVRVQAPTRRAPRHRAPPAVALEDRVRLPARHRLQPGVVDLPRPQRVVEHRVEGLRLARKTSQLALEREPQRAEYPSEERRDLPGASTRRGRGSPELVGGAHVCRPSSASPSRAARGSLHSPGRSHHSWSQARGSETRSSSASPTPSMSRRTDTVGAHATHARR